MARIPSLDGLRAISISLVLYGHLTHTRGFPKFDPGIDYTHLGVSVFFIISGFLITTLLMEEQARRGHVSLSGFYLRRAARIVPAFGLFLAGIMLASALHWIQLTRSDVLAALTFTVNFDLDRSWDIGHLWSLSVEEQFYLLWPLAILLLKAGNRSLLVAIGMFLLAPLVRLCMHIALHGPIRDLEVFPAVCDAIAIGCILALCRERLLRSQTYLRLTGRGVWLLLPLVVLISRFDWMYTLVGLVGTPVKLLAIAVLIERCTRDRSWLGRFLNSRAVVAVGVLSYSLYLWQQPFLIDRPSVVTAFPLNILVVFGLATLSYTLVERPFLGLRARMARQRSDALGQRGPALGAQSRTTG